MSDENNANFGKPLSTGTKVKIGAAKLGQTHSAETIVKISATQGTAIFVYDSQGSLINSFCSTRNAAEFFNCNHKTIMRYVK